MLTTEWLEVIQAERRRQAREAALARLVRDAQPPGRGVRGWLRAHVRAAGEARRPRQPTRPATDLPA